jgi:rod shape determining protein RodA
MSKGREINLADAHLGLFNIRNLKRVDPLMSILVVALAIVGFITLYSVHKSAYSAAPYHTQQMSRFFVGVLVALFIVCLDHRFLVALAPGMYLIAIAFLIAVQKLGHEAMGGQRWLRIGDMSLQPSEQTKLILVFAIAWYLSKIGSERVRRLPYFLLTFVIVGVPGLLILKQPDLGTAATLGPVTFAMLYVAGCKRWHLVFVVVAGLLMSPVAWSQLKDYQRDRLTAFINPDADPMGAGYQTRQSKISVGSGGMKGKGFGNSTQTQLQYLPEYHTDFIFAHYAEERGLVGALILISLYTAFLLQGLSFARSCPDPAGSLLGVGVVTILAFHTLVNISITIGLMPVTGIPLPFLTYGGSFYLTVMMCVGVLLSIRARRGIFIT